MTVSCRREQDLKKEEGRNTKFEKIAEKAGIPIYYRCNCGTAFCQHDSSVRDAYAVYTSETRGAYLLYKYLKGNTK